VSRMITRQANAPDTPGHRSTPTSSPGSPQPESSGSTVRRGARPSLSSTPVKLPMLMRDTVFCVILVDANTSAITVSVKKQVAEVQ
jgi:hypothetical protein